MGDLRQWMQFWSARLLRLLSIDNWKNGSLSLSHLMGYLSMISGAHILNFIYFIKFKFDHLRMYLLCWLLFGQDEGISLNCFFWVTSLTIVILVFSWGLKHMTPVNILHQKLGIEYVLRQHLLLTSMSVLPI